MGAPSINIDALLLGLGFTLFRRHCHSLLKIEPFRLGFPFGIARWACLNFFVESCFPFWTFFEEVFVMRRLISVRRAMIYSSCALDNSHSPLSLCVRYLYLTHLIRQSGLQVIPSSKLSCLRVRYALNFTSGHTRYAGNSWCNRSGADEPLRFKDLVTYKTCALSLLT